MALLCSSIFKRPAHRVLLISRRNLIHRTLRGPFKQQQRPCSLLTSDDSTRSNPSDYKIDITDRKDLSLVLEPLELDESLETIVPAPPMVHNLSAYANESPLIQKLVELGVQVHLWDRHKEICEFIIRSSYENDVEPYVKLLKVAEFEDEDIARILSLYPWLLLQSVESMDEKLSYLKIKNFDNAQMHRIISRTPKWLENSVEKIDGHLGVWQKRLRLKGSEVRDLATSDSKLILLTLSNKLILDRIMFATTNEMGFRLNELKSMLLVKPRIFRQNICSFLDKFEELHNVMGYSHRLLANYPGAFDFRLRKIKERHGFLKFIKKDQYDETKPNFVGVKDFCNGTDKEFVEHVCNVDFKLYYDYLKTL